MKKLSSIITVDGAFIFFTAFLLLYTLFKPLIKSVWGTTLTVTLLASVVTFLLIFYIDYLERKKGVKILSDENYLAFLKYLYLSDKETAVSIVKTYYERQNLTFEDKNLYFLVNNNLAVFYNFSIEKLNAGKIIHYYKLTPKNLKTVVLTCNEEIEITKTLNDLNLDIKIVTAKEIFYLLEKENALPILDNFKSKKRKLKINLKDVLKQENANKFLLWGTVFIAFSWITYFKVFYLLVGATFLITALYLRFFKKSTAI